MKIEKVVYDIYSTFTIKRFSLIVSICFFFFFFKNKINVVIEKYLLVPKDFSNDFLNILLFSTSLFFIVYFFFKIFKDKYIPSFTELLSSAIILFPFFYYYSFTIESELKWIFISFNILKIKIDYVQLIIFPLSLFLIFHLIRYILNSIIFTSKANNHDLLDDAPIEHISNDELGYGDIVKKLTQTLKSQNYNKSFTIGLVGPWGNGKSSIINLVASDLNPKQNMLSKIYNKLNFKSKEEIITIHFLPYLNHKEEDIINEFFISLSSKLSKYNGKLSNQVLDYSQKLTNLYKDKKIFDFFENHVTKIGSTPAKELYDDINCRLREINKKIVVFVDDLDRLNENEILQVLKLIRNTADFRNTFFVVAMDKDYVINRLKKNSEILNSKFIDKFFQLEIYLPELETSTLKEFIIKELVNSSLNLNGDFEIRLKEAVANKYNLFDDYIRNFRDVKRVINQIIFEYPFFQNELDLKDFMNFIYFKLRFPKLVKVLNDNRDELLDVSGEDKKYKLKVAEKPSDNKVGGISADKMFLAINRMNSNFVVLKKYLLYEQLNVENITINDFLNIDKEDYNLLIKTLACLFGEENEIKDTTSIKFENNFRKLMQQKYLETDLLENEFRELYKNEKEIPTGLIQNLYSLNKIQQLLKRFDYFNSENDYEIRRTVLILTVIYERRFDYKLYEHCTSSN